MCRSLPWLLLLLQHCLLLLLVCERFSCYVWQELWHGWCDRAVCECCCRSDANASAQSPPPLVSALLSNRGGVGAWIRWLSA